eukprot:759660-Pyramimonas_sp.AAC.2
MASVLRVLREGSAVVYGSGCVVTGRLPGGVDLGGPSRSSRRGLCAGAEAGGSVRAGGSHSTACVGAELGFLLLLRLRPKRRAAPSTEAKPPDLCWGGSRERDRKRLVPVRGASRARAAKGDRPRSHGESCGQPPETPSREMLSMSLRERLACAPGVRRDERVALCACRGSERDLDKSRDGPSVDRSIRSIRRMLDSVL